MADQKKIVEYIRKGYRGKRIVKDGIEFIQRHRGLRIGVFVALSMNQFGWSLVHLKGENRETVKDISWKKGVEMATTRAEGKTGETVPDSIRKQFEDFKKRATMAFTEKLIPVEGLKNLAVAVAVANDGATNQYSIVTTGKRHVRIFRGQGFMNLYKAMRKALAKNQSREQR
jgi:hypothetical protein